MSSPPAPSETRCAFFACSTRIKIWFAALIAVQLSLYTLLTLISSQFHFDSEGASRPLLTFYAILAAAFVAYLCSITLALRLADSAKSIALFFVVAVAVRGIVLCSEPIQEVDIYRYIWDGAVSSQGISPYRFRPSEVQQAIVRAQPVGELERLASLASERAGLGEVLRRVHFSELPTVYPPVSQVVFHFADWLTPIDAQVSTRMRVMKGVIVLFDLGVMVLLLGLVKLLGVHSGWCIAYGWSPLVIKEFANSGHLDSIAVFLVVASILCIMIAWHRLLVLSPPRFVGERVRERGKAAGHRPPDSISSDRRVAPACPLSLSLSPKTLTASYSFVQTCCMSMFWGGGDKKSRPFILGSAVLIGLSVGAKLYPIVLLPLMACFVWRQLGHRRSIAWFSVACVTIVVSVAPMVVSHSDGEQRTFSVDSSTQLQGLTTFLSRWEINDLLFMIVEENIRPEGSVEGQPHLWFAVTPNAWRMKLTAAVSMMFAGDVERTPFLLTRILTTLALVAIVSVLCRRIWQEPTTFFEAMFLTLAWFWFLSPTQNPWYWIWALPLVPWARNRAWLLVSGLALIYYSRFWFQYHSGTTASWGLPYQGVAIFDFFVVWIEFAPFLLLLFCSSNLRKFGRSSEQPAIPNH